VVNILPLYISTCKIRCLTAQQSSSTTSVLF